MKTWYQLYWFSQKEDKIKCLGFSVTNGYVTDHPEKYVWQGEQIETYKKRIVQLPYFQVVKICDTPS